MSHPMVLLPLLTLMIVGCGTAEPIETPTPSTGSVTPTAATATPTPTPTPISAYDEWFAVTWFQIAGENDGLDYDGDSSKDNGIHLAFSTMQEAIVVGVTASLDDQTDFPDQEDPCESTQGGCTLSPDQNQQAAEGAELLVEGLVSVDAINGTLAAAFDGGARPYALHIYQDGANYQLDFWTGSLDDTLYVVDEQIGSQSSAALSTGVPTTYGPGSFVFEVDIGVRDPQTIGFQVYEAQTIIGFEDDALGGLTGGGVKITALADVVDVVLQALVNGGVIPEETDTTEIVVGVEDALLSVSDITCDGGEACISITFEFDALLVELAP